MGMALQLAGAGIQAFGTVEQGQATANAANFNAQVARNNAAYASKVGQQQATLESMKSAVSEGGIKASQASHGINVNTGSAVKVQQGAREAGEINTQTVENNALLTAYGYQQEGNLQEAEAKEAPIGADIGAAGGLLSSVGALSEKWAGMAAGGAGG